MPYRSLTTPMGARNAPDSARRESSQPSLDLTRANFIDTDHCRMENPNPLGEDHHNWLLKWEISDQIGVDEIGISRSCSSSHANCRSQVDSLQIGNKNRIMRESPVPQWRGPKM